MALWRVLFTLSYQHMYIPKNIFVYAIDKFQNPPIFCGPRGPNDVITQTKIITANFAPYRNRTFWLLRIYVFIVSHLVGSAWKSRL